MNILLNIKTASYSPYINILASNDSKVLGYVIKNSDLKVLTKYSDIEKLNSKERELFEIDQKAYRLQEVLLNGTNKDINTKFNMRKVK